MSRGGPSEGRVGVAVGLLSVCVTGITYALAVRPVALSDIAFWVVIAFSALFAGAAVAVARPRRPRPRVVAAAKDCRRVETVLTDLLAQSRRDSTRFPRPWLRSGGGGAADPVETYETQHRKWVAAVYEEALALGAATRISRRLIEGRSIAHIALLPELFADAAATLEARARREGRP